ncbi:phosphatidylinositol-specific phospholipase C/glycerophosphodiester phosphodiesterase family protein [Streptomyces sp. NPDC050560]|uniref:phosphatidylinositol-specific phospholipase C/glycerophosphodiester phosphodiesterase family protein n=1 Tax=Streptomyces sp. NPDC050560 TaxID=3365630 RepID=UPI0037B0A3BA
MALTTRRSALTVFGAALACAGFAIPTASAQSPHRRRGLRPLTHAHAHNDYDHPRPLLDALDHRFGSVEADIYLVDGELLVAHDLADLDPSRTLESLYLDPLLARVRANGGSVYQGWHTSLELLIDIKTDGAAAYRALDRRLRPYRQMLTEYTAGTVTVRAVTPVISGDRAARAPMEEQERRYAFYDGRLDDLGSGALASFIPLISDNWSTLFTWRGTGDFPSAESDRLNDIVTTAHDNGQRVRFWETPDTPGPARDALWGELLTAGVDLLNTDDLAGLEAFLDAHGGD